MASCIKQLEAAQRFLRGILELPAYGEFVEKQAIGIKKVMEKLREATPAEAASILGAIDTKLWRVSHVEMFRAMIASKTRAVLEESLRTTQQDFTTLPYFLSEELYRKVLTEGNDKDQLLFDVCAHAAKLSLRVGTEATKASIIALAYWTHLRQGMSAKEKYNLYLKKKPQVTRYLSLPPPATTISDLPLAYDDLPSALAQAVFPTGRPVENKDLAADVMQFVRNMPLRKDHHLLQSDTAVAGAASAEPAAAQLSVDAICRVVEACSRGLHGPPEPTRPVPVDAPLPAQGPMLAIEDGPVEEKTSTGFLPKLGEQVEQKENEMTVEQQLELLQGNFNMLPTGALKRPAAKQGLKRPASEKDLFKRPAAAVEAASETHAVVPKQAGSTGSGKRPAAKAMPKSKAKAKARPKANAEARAAARKPTRKQVRQSILKQVPAKLKRMYRQGCKKCRSRALCTPSCWAVRGYFPS